MSKIIYSVGAIAVLFAVAFVWSNTALVSPHASPASTIGLAHRTAASPDNAAPASPTDMMINHGALRSEQWDAH